LIESIYLWYITKETHIHTQKKDQSLSINLYYSMPGIDSVEVSDSSAEVKMIGGKLRYEKGKSDPADLSPLDRFSNLFLLSQSKVRV